MKRHILYTIALTLTALTATTGLMWANTIPDDDTVELRTADQMHLADSAKVINQRISEWAKYYSHPDCKLKPSKLSSLHIDDSLHTIVVTLGGGFSEQVFTPTLVDTISRHIRSLLPKEARHYALTVMTEGHDIAYLVPNHLRHGKKDRARLIQQPYSGRPWVNNIQRPHTITRGLNGRHIALWASHGRYVDHNKREWAWQRPRLFCTTEDLLSQTIVVPYLIPMLENAGAVVYTPRERDWQVNEVVVDNDQPDNSGHYTETYSPDSQHQWTTSPTPGFAHLKDIYQACDSPFVDGTARCISTVQHKDHTAEARWTLSVPQSGRYAVYVAYQTHPRSVDDALYTVYHSGGTTQYRVNQQMGGGVWVYLGTHEFAQGTSTSGMVTLSNLSSSHGIVTADAVRIGGGMGNVVPAIALSDTTNAARASAIANMPVSGLPRWAEAAKYSAVWSGIPYANHTEPFGINDYNNDINTRSAAVNYLMGSSPYFPHRQGGGLGVPLDLTLALHTDAGTSADDRYIGSLSIYMPDYNDGLTGAGLDRYVSRDLASLLLHNLHTDLRQYGWTIRQVRNGNYGEARMPMTPTCILEMLSHQNFADMRLAYNPQFKFDYARSVYKTIVKFLSTQYGTPYTIQPLPVTDLHIRLDEADYRAHISWCPQTDPTEPSARPTAYIVYTRRGQLGFDSGTLVHGTSATVALTPGEVTSFRVTAVNQGGESFPSETLAAGIAPDNRGTVLVVNAFTRLEGPAVVNTPTTCGFDLDADPGVPYGPFNGYCGRQLHFLRSKAGGESGDALGVSGSELEGQTIMGNTFDYAAIHGTAIMSSGQHSFTSCSQSSLVKGMVRLADYPIADIIYGVQRQFDTAANRLIADYANSGGRLIVSAANPGCPEVGSTATGTVADRTVRDITGCGMTFSIYRDMNPVAYSVPSPTVLTPVYPAFAMLAYSDGSYAGVAQQRRFVRLGFPLEAIIEHDKLNQLMTAFLNFLE